MADTANIVASISGTASITGDSVSGSTITSSTTTSTSVTGSVTTGGSVTQDLSNYAPLPISSLPVHFVFLSLQQAVRKRY